MLPVESFCHRGLIVFILVHDVVYLLHFAVKSELVILFQRPSGAVSLHFMIEVHLGYSIVSGAQKTLTAHASLEFVFLQLRTAIKITEHFFVVRCTSSLHFYCKTIAIHSFGLQVVGATKVSSAGSSDLVLRVVNSELSISFVKEIV